MYNQEVGYVHDSWARRIWAGHGQLDFKEQNSGIWNMLEFSWGVIYPPGSEIFLISVKMVAFT